MNQKLTFMLALLGLAMTSTGCGKQCREAKEAILEPTKKVASYLVTAPSGSELANAGCLMIQAEFARLPEGSTTIRQIADERFSHDITTCVRWNQGRRYVCEDYSGPYSRYRRCYWAPYSYCEAWNTDQVQQPGYREAIALSTSLDQLYERTQQMCQLAESGDLSGAEFASRNLLQFMKTEVQPSSQKVYKMACGSSASSEEDWGN